MLQRIFLTLFVFAASVGGGAASVWYILGTQEGIGALTIGGWTAFPKIGTPGADPYSKARIAREGVLSLGRAEGLTFIAERDSDGRPLRRDCSYSVKGSTPPARFWTLFAADKSLVVLDDGGARFPATHSQEILRRADNSFIIAFGPHPVAGNWIPIKGTGPMTFLLTLYDTPIETNTGIDGIELPQVTRTVCDG
ncbi:DUF1214 domain-containing protein [Mesorhizobium sp. 1B3]|uniref:DUF1214 domain-containing protein n=1 Tax=Mesorhizobium sp. 1B3 TaxID=3243599 RepID=UPI003D99634B